MLKAESLEWIKKLIKESKMTQKQFSQAIGKTEAGVCRYLDGTSVPKIDTCIRMAKVLNVTLDVLFLFEMHKED